MKKTKKALATLALMGMAATLVPFNVLAATGITTDRLYGADRIGTAVNVAEKFVSATTAILAPAADANLVDALAAAPLAGKNTPILLTEGNMLNAAAKAELIKLGVTKVYVVGAISQAVCDEVEAMTGVTAIPLKGADRMATAAAINAKLTSPAGTFVVGYDALADALSVASYAAANNFSIVVTNPDGSLPSGVTPASPVYMVGGPTLVKEIAGATRLFGADRFATNKSVLDKFNYSYNKVYVANGVDAHLVDSLVASSLAAASNAPIVLTDTATGGNAAAASVGALLANNAVVVALGGPTVVSDATVAKVTSAVPAVLAVSSVSAINATQVQVKFNAAVDAVDGIVLARYQIGGISPASVVLSTDQMTATLTFALATSVEVTNAAVVVNPIQSKDDDLKLSLRHVGLITFEDVTNPVVSKVESKTNTTVATSVTVTFSEPINTLGTVKIDGVVKTAPTFVAGNTTATFTGLSLTASASHTIQFIGLTDQGANVLALDTQTFAITTDKVAPTATLSASGDHTILVTFDKPMTSATVLAALTAANNYVKDATLSNIAYSNATAVASTDDKQYKIVVTADPFATATTKTLTVVLPSTMTDSLGNAFVGTTQQITFTKDVTAPTISKVTPKVNAAGLVIGFTVSVSEGLKAAAITPSNTNIVIVDSNGVLIPTTGASSLLGGLNAALPVPVAGDTSFYIPVVTPAAKTGVLYFSFAGSLFQDTAFTANNSAAANFTVNFGSATTINTFTLAQGSAVIASNVITVTYANAVKGGGVAGSATTLSNYTLNGSVLPAGTTITLDATQKIATITLPAGSVATSDTGAVFTINNVTQLTGEVIVAFTKPLSVLDNTAPVMNYAVLNADNSITVGFTETVSGIINTDLVVKVNGSTLTTGALVATPGAGLNAGKFVLALDSLVINAAGVTYLDMDGTGTNTLGDLVLATEASKTTTILGSIATTSVTLGTQAAALTGKDAANNVIKSATSLTVK